VSGAVVVDASLAVKWVLAESYTFEARSLLVDWERQSVLRLVPALFASEIAAPLLRRCQQGVLSLALAEQAVQDLLSAVMVRPLDALLAVRALQIADALQQRRAYDSLYLAMAEHEHCELWTADERLWNGARTTFPWVHWVGQVSAQP
jgi:predicted nucleic acid-binding protein